MFLQYIKSIVCLKFKRVIYKKDAHDKGGPVGGEEDAVVGKHAELAGLGLLGLGQGPREV